MINRKMITKLIFIMIIMIIIITTMMIMINCDYDYDYDYNNNDNVVIIKGPSVYYRVCYGQKYENYKPI